MAELCRKAAHPRLLQNLDTGQTEGACAKNTLLAQQQQQSGVTPVSLAQRAAINARQDKKRLVELLRAGVCPTSGHAQSY